MTESRSARNRSVFRELERRGDDLLARLAIYIADLRKDPRDCRRGVLVSDCGAWVAAVKEAVLSSFPEGSDQRNWLESAHEFRKVRNDYEYSRSGNNPHIADMVQVDSDYYERLMGVVRWSAMLEPTSEDEPMVVNVSVGSNSGILNIASQLDNAIQSVEGSSALSPQRKVEWASLISELQQVLRQVPATSGDDAELVSEIAGTMAKELEKPKPRPGALRISASGLIEAAKTLSAVVPPVMDVAGRLAKFVVSPLG